MQGHREFWIRLLNPLRRARPASASPLQQQITFAEDGLNPDLGQLYAIYRAYMQHEDDLINQRSTWHLTLQGFLFAALGVALQWEEKPSMTPSVAATHAAIIWIIPVLGALISGFAFLSVLAADNAINRLRNDWRWIVLSHKCSWKHLYPGLAGAGSEFSAAWGKSPSVIIPALIALAWLFVLGVQQGAVATKTRKPEMTRVGQLLRIDQRAAIV